MAMKICETFPLRATQQSQETKETESVDMDMETEAKRDGYDNHSNLNIKERSKEQPPILRIPVDVLATIDDRFTWADRFRFSQTCKTLRNYWGGNWIERVGNMPEDDKFEFWFGIAYTLPNHWVCSGCCDLHRLRVQDTPKRPDSYDCRSSSKRTTYVWGYRIGQRHVQLALKYDKLRSIYPLHLRYLTKLLAPHATREGWFRCDRVKQPLSSRLDVHYQPRIVNGQFILSKTCIFSAKWWSLRPLCIGRWNHFLCPHECLLPTIPMANSLREDYADQAGELGRVVKEACDSPGKEIAHHCTQCPLDYAVTLCHRRKLRIEAWYDLGSYGPELAYLWKRSRAPVSHVPGSIRAMYNG